MIVPARRQVDDALDRLERIIDGLYASGDVREDHFRVLATVREALEQLREERDWWIARANDGTKLGVTGGRITGKSLVLRAETAEAEADKYRKATDQQARRAEAAEAELERLTEGLREIVGESYGILTQGESRTQKRGPAARRIYDKARALLADSPDGANTEGGEA